MSQVRQVGLLAAGCQPWNKDVCAASGDRFAYCATLAIYIYQLDHRYNEFKLRAIMSEHKKTITAISWCPHNPDLFASGSTDNLVIIWNVAEQKVIAKLNNTKVSIQSSNRNHYTSSTSEAVPPPSLTQNQAFSLPPGHAVCCFLDGGVGLYDLGAKKWDFLRDLGHVETIFDCKFKPDDPNLLATASFDGTIKVWDINTLTAMYTSPGNEGVIYSLSWAPDYAIEQGTPPLLCGKVSRDIKQEIEKLTGNPRVKKLRWFSECLSSEAQELTTVKMSKFGGGIGVPTKEERLKEAAEIHLRLGQIQRYCELMVELGEAACEGNVQDLHVSTPKGASYSDDIYKEDFNELLHKVSEELAERYFQDGRAVLAACCHLAVDNIELAMAYLIRGNELELAVCVGMVLGEPAAPATHYALELLARKCMMIPMWNLAADLLLMIPDNELHLVKLCAFYPGSMEEINDIHEKCKLPTVEECMQLAETAHADGNVFETIKYYLLSQEPEKALSIGIDFVKARNELLILCGYIGALLAIRRQYQSIVPALYEYTSQLLKRRKVSVPLKIEHLSEELDAWRACTHPTNQSSEEPPYAPPSDSQRMVYATLLKKLKEEPLEGIIGPDYVTGSNLPSHSDIHISCLTGLKIQGPVFFLEDGKSAISLNDALMWAKVNPFSPLGTGLRLNPF
ncbi:WD repeat-containing protein 17 [Sciurus carolinensis]|uniref:WD repeat-containing protein 17 n=1 Tax=Sciurus carolinensis TaxID=30640 RepID=A0AA41T664_SCICA|nr:WD repeat-containing protein 17 [Sciurus carolinensis]